MSETTALEKATLRRVSVRLLPFLMLACLVCYIDRTNAGFAALQMVGQGVDPADLGLGQAKGSGGATTRIATTNASGTPLSRSASAAWHWPCAFPSQC